ncbi:MAG: glycosyltransferase family 4 protein [Bacteroidetes bacterium]|nr:glycosyltransferase family 4 protein [Bacteroidota bacterium]
MKILFGIHGTTHTEIAQSEIIEFQKLGVHTDVCTYGNWGTASGFIGSIKLVLKNAKELKRRAAEQQSDMVYLNTGLDFKTLVRDSITLFILRRYSKQLKIVLKIHGSQSRFIFSKTNLLNRYVFKQADMLLVLSKEEKQNFLSVGLPEKKVQVTANVIDTNNYKADPAFKTKEELAASTTVLLFVGRFMPEKGILDLIEAAKMLTEKKVDYTLICLGNGPLFDEVQQKVNAYGLSNNVNLKGHVKEAEAGYYYSNCDILVLPTYHEEGFPMAVFQAVGAGKAVITTNIRGAADHMKEYENCLWVEAKNPAQLCTQIKNLVYDKPLQEKMQRNNLMLAEKFTAQKIVGKLMEYFKLIV